MSVPAFTPHTAGEFLTGHELDIELVDGAIRYIAGQVAARPLGDDVVFLSFVDQRHDVSLIACRRDDGGAWQPVGLLQRASAWSIDRGLRRLPDDFELTAAMRDAIAAAVGDTVNPTGGR